MKVVIPALQHLARASQHADIHRPIALKHGPHVASHMALQH
jgi:hypothetical protein